MPRPSMDEYVEVADRIAKFYERHPDGRLTRLGEPKIITVGERLFVQYTALAYRTPDDPRPALGTAWEPFPGPTQFTRDSELMNAETAAWGRAIVAAGIPAKKIASREEVNARSGPPVPTIDAEKAKALAQTAKEAVELGAVDPKTLGTRLRALGATDTSSVGAAIATLTPDAAAQLTTVLDEAVSLAREAVPA